MLSAPALLTTPQSRVRVHTSSNVFRWIRDPSPLIGNQWFLAYTFQDNFVFVLTCLFTSSAKSLMDL